MKFLVEWDPEARREIQAAGVADAVRMSLREAVEKTDRALALDPLQAGESRDDVTLRVAIFAPLTVYFAVIPEQGTVRIVHCVVSLPG